MIIITWRVTCRTHDIDKAVTLKGAATKRQLKKGDDIIERTMKDSGCTDYNVTHSVTHGLRDHENAGLYA